MENTEMDALLSQPATQSALRIPQFWTHDPILWFAHVDAQLVTHRIRSDAARLNHIIGSLTHEVMAEVRDYIMAPPGTVPYDTFRAGWLDEPPTHDRNVYASFSWTRN